MDDNPQGTITERLCLAGKPGSLEWEASAEIERLRAEVARLQRVIDSRPAINAALPGSYERWSQSIYVMEMPGARS